jgi:hypothetical protein
VAERIKNKTMGYILMEESLFKRLMRRLLLDKDITGGEFTEKDYWMTGKEVCHYLNISTALLNAYRKSNILFYCRIKEIYHYKRSEVYKLKAHMDVELLESGKLLGCIQMIDTEKNAIKVFEKDLQGMYFENC